VKKGQKRRPALISNRRKCHEPGGLICRGVTMSISWGTTLNLRTAAVIEHRRLLLLATVLLIEPYGGAGTPDGAAPGQSQAAQPLPAPSNYGGERFCRTVHTVTRRAIRYPTGSAPQMTPWRFTRSRGQQTGGNKPWRCPVRISRGRAHRWTTGRRAQRTYRKATSSPRRERREKVQTPTPPPTVAIGRAR